MALVREYNMESAWVESISHYFSLQSWRWRSMKRLKAWDKDGAFWEEMQKSMKRCPFATLSSAKKTWAMCCRNPRKQCWKTVGTVDSFRQNVYSLKNVETKNEWLEAGEAWLQIQNQEESSELCGTTYIKPTNSWLSTWRTLKDDNTESSEQRGRRLQVESGYLLHHSVFHHMNTHICCFSMTNHLYSTNPLMHSSQRTG